MSLTKVKKLIISSFFVFFLLILIDSKVDSAEIVPMDVVTMQKMHKVSAPALSIDKK